jgi:hypothetical protein
LKIREREGDQNKERLVGRGSKVRTDSREADGGGGVRRQRRGSGCGKMACHYMIDYPGNFGIVRSPNAA